MVGSLLLGAVWRSFTEPDLSFRYPKHLIYSRAGEITGRSSEENFVPRPIASPTMEAEPLLTGIQQYIMTPATNNSTKFSSQPQVC